MASVLGHRTEELDHCAFSVRWVVRLQGGDDVLDSDGFH